MCAKYHEPSLSSSPDIVLTRLNRFTMHVKKGAYFSQMFIELYEKVNQVISIMYTNSMPDIMILAQALRQICC